MTVPWKLNIWEKILKNVVALLITLLLTPSDEKLVDYLLQTRSLDSLSYQFLCYFALKLTKITILKQIQTNIAESEICSSRLTLFIHSNN